MGMGKNFIRTNVKHMEKPIQAIIEAAAADIKKAICDGTPRLDNISKQTIVIV